MKIGFDAKRAYKNNTGLGNYSRMIISSMSDDDLLYLFTPDTKGRYKDLFSDLKNVSVVTPKGLWRLVPGLWRTFGIAPQIRRLNLDVYHGLSHELPRGRVGETRLVVSMHDLIVWRYPKQFPFVDRLIYKLKQRHSCRRADTIVAISEQTAHDLVEIMGTDSAKIKVVYQSCDTIFRQPVSDEQRAAVREKYSLPDKYLLCVGTIEQRKNQAAIVRALSGVDAGIHLVIVGKKTGYYETVKETVCELGIGSRVHFLNGVDFADFPALYSEAFASVYMSIFEGFGIPVLESLSCGTPVIASCRSSIPEVGGDAALYADPDNPKEIVDRIHLLLGDKELYDTMRLRGKNQAARFSPDSIVSDLQSLYVALAEQ